MHAVAEQVLDGQGVAPIGSAAFNFDELAGVFVVEIVSAFEDDHAQIRVLHFPGDAVGEEVELDFHGEPGAGHDLEVHGERVVRSVLIRGHGRPRGQGVGAFSGCQGGQRHQRAHARFQLSGPQHGEGRSAIQRKVDGGFRHGLRAEILQGDVNVMGRVAPNRGETLQGGNARILCDHRHEPIAFQQAGSVAKKRIAHPGPLSFRESAHALIIGVVHVVLDHRLGTVQGAASCAARGGRSVAYLITL